MVESERVSHEAQEKICQSKIQAPKDAEVFPIDDQMKELSAMLEKELSDWPGISNKPMFGYQGLYRDGQIFAALPRSRAMKSPTSIMFKFTSISPAILESAKKDSRVDTVSGMSGSGWFFFELDDASATKGALGWLGRAYEAVKK